MEFFHILIDLKEIKDYHARHAMSAALANAISPMISSMAYNNVTIPILYWNLYWYPGPSRASLGRGVFCRIEPQEAGFGMNFEKRERYQAIQEPKKRKKQNI